MTEARGRYTLVRAVAEFAVIVTGVLMALVVDEWRGNLRDRAAETRYVERLIADLRFDSLELSGAPEAVSEKQVRLQRLLALSAPDLSRDSRLLAGAANDLGRAWTWGFDYPSARRLTFNEILSVGRLDLISDLEVREAISRYYWLHEDTEDRIESRRTSLPGLSYELVREETTTDVPEGSAVYTVDPDALAATLASGELHRAATAEMAFSRYLLANSERLTTEAGALIRRLTAYLDERAE
jgi:hypothetical protein